MYIRADNIYEALPKQLFSIISPGDTVVLKPNWVLEEHQYRKGEWEQVITNPAIITAVLRIVVDYLENRGHIIIADGPELNADFDKILSLPTAGGVESNHAESAQHYPSKLSTFVRNYIYKTRMLRSKS